MIFKTVSLLILLLYLTSVQATKSEAHKYTVNFNKFMTGLAVKACFADNQPEKLINYNDTKIKHLKHAYIITGDQKKSRLRTNSRFIHLPSMHQKSCVLYDIEYTGTTTHPWFKKQQSSSDQILLDIHSWLWFPDNFNIDSDALDITFNLPDGMEISAPWKKIEQRNVINGQYITYRYEQRPPGWAGSVAIGRFKKRSSLKALQKLNLLY